MNVPENASTRTITIAGLQFTIPEPFTAEHMAAAAELGAPENLAAVMNQTFSENVRNNNATKVKKAVEKAAKNETEVDVAALQTDIDSYIAEYQFGVRKTGTARSFASPVDREMYNLARDKVKAALQGKGIKLKDMDKEKLEDLIDGVIAKHTDVLRAKAEKLVAMKDEIANDGLEIEV
jgi:hypothetical protein